MLLRKRMIGTLLLCLLFVSVPLLLRKGSNPIASLLHALLPTKTPENTVPPTTHIVLFQFKPGTTPVQIKEVTSRMLGLRRSCIHPSTGAPYIKSMIGGKDNSIEELQHGMSYAFVVQFYTNEDRTYYVNNDPAHRAFKDTVAPYVEKAQVVDFQEGVFTDTD